MHRLVFRSAEMDSPQAPVVFVVLGPPGAGKGTQSGMLASLLQLPHISVGNILRSYAEDKSEVGLRLRGMMALGTLVPDTLVLDVLAAWISEPDCARGLILDGFPRTLRQADLLERGLLKSPFYSTPSRATQHNCGETLWTSHLFSLWCDVPPRNSAATDQR